MGLFALGALFVGARNETASRAARPQPVAEAQPSPTPAVIRDEPEETSSIAGVYDEPLVRQASAMSKSSGGTGDGLGALLVLNGALCAKVVSAKPQARPHFCTVTCKTRRAGSGTSVYSFDAAEGQARLLDHS